MINLHFPLFASIVGGLIPSIFAPSFASALASACGPVLASAFAPVFAPAPAFAAVIGGEIFNLVRQTGGVAQGVLIIFCNLSFFSWYLFLYQWASYNLS